MPVPLTARQCDKSHYYEPSLKFKLDKALQCAIKFSMPLQHRIGIRWIDNLYGDKSAISVFSKERERISFCIGEGSIVPEVDMCVSDFATQMDIGYIDRLSVPDMMRCMPIYISVLRLSAMQCLRNVTADEVAVCL